MGNIAKTIMGISTQRGHGILHIESRVFKQTYRLKYLRNNWNRIENEIEETQRDFRNEENAQDF